MEHKNFAGQSYLLKNVSSNSCKIFPINIFAEIYSHLLILALHISWDEQMNGPRSRVEEDLRRLNQLAQILSSIFERDRMNFILV